MKILVTGANGFIGKAICKALLENGYTIRAVIRKTLSTPFLKHKNLEIFPNGEISNHTDWSVALHDIDVVIHTAARAHQMSDNQKELLTEYLQVNTAGTLHLLKNATRAGVKKIIFLSSIKVNGEVTFDKPFTELNSPNPMDAYAMSKWEAEQGIQEWCKENKSINYTIIRLPLVYGLGVKANFANLIKLVKSGFPLPMGSIQNKRSLLYIGNLTSALNTILKNSSSDNKTYLISDGDDISTPQLISVIASAYNIKPRLTSLPTICFTWLGYLTCKSKAISRLLNSLQVDTSKIKQDLNWNPPYTVASGLAEMVKHEKAQ